MPQNRRFVAQDVLFLTISYHIRQGPGGFARMRNPNQIDHTLI